MAAGLSLRLRAGVCLAAAAGGVAEVARHLARVHVAAQPGALGDFGGVVALVSAGACALRAISVGLDRAAFSPIDYENPGIAADP